MGLLYLFYLLKEILRVQTHFTILPDFISEFAVLMNVTMLKMLPTNIAHTF